MENNNSVAYVGRINSIEEIPGADFIVLAKVDDWHSVVKKDQFKVGDMVGVLTTDALIPKDLVDKLGIESYLRNSNRVRTVRLKSVYSECLLINLWEVYGTATVFPVKEGKCLQKDLNVYKYEPEATFIHTDGGVTLENKNFQKYEKFPNAKNVAKLFNELDLVVATRKYHGTNFRAGIVKKQKLSIIDRIKKIFGNHWAGYEYVIGSHNKQRSINESSIYKSVSDDNNTGILLWDYVKNRLNPEDIGSGFIVYGEIYGDGVQGEFYNYGLYGKSLICFDIQVNGKYLPWYDFKYIAGIIGLHTVPVLYEGFYDKNKINETMGGYIPCTVKTLKVPNEGVVVKTVLGRRKVAKFINNEYLTFAEKKSVPDSH